MSKILRFLFWFVPISLLQSLKHNIECYIWDYDYACHNASRKLALEQMKQYLLDHPELELELQYSPLTVLPCQKYGHEWPLLALRLNKLRRLTKELHGIKKDE